MGRTPPPSPGPAALFDARRVRGGPVDPDTFSYTVLIDPMASKPQPGERREAPRRRTRLRSGKIVDGNNMFLTECLVHDLSDTGMRLRVPAGVAVPTAFRVYDDQSGRLQRAEVSWRRADELGIRFTPEAETPRSRASAAEMRRTFYKTSG